jgi:hypothetical protein
MTTTPTVGWSKLKDDPVFQAAARQFWSNITNRIPVDLLTLDLDRWNLSFPNKFGVQKMRLALRQCPECEEYHDRSFFSCCTDDETGKDWALDEVELTVYAIVDLEYDIAVSADEGDITVYSHGKDNKVKSFDYYEFDDDAEKEAEERNRRAEQDYDVFPFDGSRKCWLVESCEDHVLLKKAGFVSADYQIADSYRSRGYDYTFWSTDGDPNYYYALYAESRTMVVPTTHGDAYVDTEELSAMEQFAQELQRSEQEAV